MGTARGILGSGTVGLGVAEAQASVLSEGRLAPEDLPSQVDAAARSDPSAAPASASGHPSASEVDALADALHSGGAFTDAFELYAEEEEDDLEDDEEEDDDDLDEDDDFDPSEEEP